MSDDDGKKGLLPNAEEEAAGMKPRKCTDILVLLVFLAYMGGMGYILNYALEVGDVRRLSHGFNYKGRLCGVDPGYEDRPLLYFCPNGPMIPGSDPPVPANLDLLHPICVSACPVSAAQSYLCYSGAEVVTSEPENAEGDYKEEITYDFVRTDGYPSYTFMHRFCVPQAEHLAKEALAVVGDGAIAQAMMKVGTIRSGYPALVVACGLAFFLGYAYLFLLKIFARPLVYACLFGLVASCAGGGLYLVLAAENGGVSAGVGDGPTCYVAGIVLLVLAVIFLALVCCKKNAIDIGIACVEGACEAMFAMPTMLLQPACELATKMVVLGLMLYGFMWVMSTGDVKSSSATIGGVKVKGLSRTFSWKEEEIWYMVAWIFGTFWVAEVFTALGQFVVSYSVVLWYFTPKDSDGRKAGVKCPLLRGFFVGIFFHLGTIAFGAFLIAACRLIRLILGYIAKQSEKAGNAVMAMIAKALMCLITCFQRFLEFINKTAYMDVAVQSSNFCTAAYNAFSMIMSNAATVAILNGACFIFQVVGAVVISGAGGFLTFYLVTTHAAFTSNESELYIADPMFISGVASLCSCVVAVAFMIIFDQTADTLLYCFCYEKSLGMGGRFAPDGLARLIADKGGKE